MLGLAVHVAFGVDDKRGGNGAKHNSLYNPVAFVEGYRSGTTRRPHTANNCRGALCDDDDLGYFEGGANIFAVQSIQCRTSTHCVGSMFVREVSAYLFVRESTRSCM